MKKNKRGGNFAQGQSEVTNQNKNSQQPKDKSSKKQKYILSNLHEKKSASNIKKILLFPGEEYEFNEKLIHYDAFGFKKGKLVSKHCGILLCDSNDKAVEDSNEEVFKSLGKYYSPKVDDPVLGVIVQKTSEFYKVDIGSYTHAILSSSEFEGATKKQKPNLNLGDVIFARILKVNKFDAPLLSCISLHEHKNWASGESFFGNLKGGMVFNFNRANTWEFYKENYAIERLNDVVNYEIIIGFNGRIWIQAENAEDVYNIYQILMSSITQTKEEVEKNIHSVFLP